MVPGRGLCRFGADSPEERFGAVAIPEVDASVQGQEEQPVRIERHGPGRDRRKAISLQHHGAMRLSRPAGDAFPDRPRDDRRSWTLITLSPISRSCGCAALLRLLPLG